MIIKSMLDDDLYKFTMCQAVIAKFPQAKARYQFINRGEAKFTERFVQSLIYEICEMSTLRLSVSEMMFLMKECKEYLYPPFFEWLSQYQYNPTEVKLGLGDDGQLSVEIEGPWYRTILWEVKLMALISELYFRDKAIDICSVSVDAVLKAHEINHCGLKVIDFGTRRRFSTAVHVAVLSRIREQLVGTSNLKMAMEHGLPVIGTMAHEWIMAHGAICDYSDANESALLNWRDIYGDSLSTALTDTYTSDVFFRNSRGIIFNAIRQDSGDPLAFTDKAIRYYEEHGVDPKSKKIVFSDSLDIAKATKIAEYCEGKIPCTFGIGTHLTNDIYGIKPLNMVIKMIAFAPNGKDWVHTVKLSDDSGKHTGDPEEVDRCKKSLGIS